MNKKMKTFAKGARDHEKALVEELEEMKKVSCICFSDEKKETLSDFYRFMASYKDRTL